MKNLRNICLRKSGKNFKCSISFDLEKEIWFLLFIYNCNIQIYITKKSVKAIGYKCIWIEVRLELSLNNKYKSWFNINGFKIKVLCQFWFNTKIMTLIIIDINLND